MRKAALLGGGLAATVAIKELVNAKNPTLIAQSLDAPVQGNLDQIQLSLWETIIVRTLARWSGSMPTRVGSSTAIAHQLGNIIFLIALVSIGSSL